MLFSSQIPKKKILCINIRYKNVIMDIVSLLLLCAVNGIHTTFQHLFLLIFLYSEILK